MARQTLTAAGVALRIGAALLGLGMCWSHLRRRLTGQIDVDEPGRL